MAFRTVSAWGAALTVLASATLMPVTAHAQSSREPAKNSPLKRTNTKIKPKPSKPTSSAPKASKPLSTIKPTGRTHTARQGPLCVPMDAIRRAVFGQNEMQEIVRNNSSGDIDVSLDGVSARVSEVYTVDGMPAQDQAMKNVVKAVREGRSASSNEELQDIVRGGQKDIESVRAEYLSKGYEEVRMNQKESVFVKANDPCSQDNVKSMLEDRVSDRMYREWLDEWGRYSDTNEWIYDGGASGSGCRTCSGGVCSTTPAIDTFILRGTLSPSVEPTENELAELDMSDAERAENALLQGDYSLAIDRYESCLKDNPEDARSLRGFAVTLLQSNRLTEAVTKMGDAYRLDPTLADEPVNLDYFSDGSRTITELLQRVVPMAHKSPAYHASLSAAVLMQAQGRKKESERMLAKASEKGLPDAIEREFLLRQPDSNPANAKK